MNTEALEKMMMDQLNGPHAGYLAADMARLLPQMNDPARCQGAVATLQSWAASPNESLRKAFATEFLERARAALGGHSVQGVVARHTAPAATQPVSAVERFKRPAASNDNHARGFLVQEEHASGRLEAPMPARHEPESEAAHRTGAKLAGVTAKHAFRLGVLAAGAGSAAGAAHHALSDKQRAQRSAAAKSRWSRLKGAPATPMQKIFGVHGHIAPNIPDSAIWNNRDGGECPTCGKNWPKMAKGDIQRPPSTDTDLAAQAAAYAAADRDAVSWSKDQGGTCPTCGHDWPAPQHQVSVAKAGGPIDLSKAFDSSKHARGQHGKFAGKGGQDSHYKPSWGVRQLASAGALAGVVLGLGVGGRLGYGIGRKTASKLGSVSDRIAAARLNSLSNGTLKGHEIFGDAKDMARHEASLYLLHSTPEQRGGLVGERVGRTVGGTVGSLGGAGGVLAADRWRKKNRKAEDA